MFWKEYLHSQFYRKYNPLFSSFSLLSVYLSFSSNGDFRVILDLGPATKGHALILPKEHADNLYELPDETASKVFVLAYLFIYPFPQTEMPDPRFSKYGNPLSCAA